MALPKRNKNITIRLTTQPLQATRQHHQKHTMKETIGSTGTVPGHRALVAGEQWHRSGFTLEMLPHGYRPLLMGEVEQDGDEFFGPVSGEWINSPDARKVVDDRHHVRTTRPLPAIETPAAPQPQQSSYSDGGAAFPCEEQIRCGGEVIDIRKFTGMTLRDWFAGQALVGVESSYDPSSEWPGPLWCDEAAAHCYEIADAMLKAREVKP
jgi:hypothetical protein